MTPLKMLICSSTIGEIVDERVKAGDSIVIVAGDPNAAVGGSRFNKLENLRSRFGGFRVIREATRKSSQIDHVLAFYDPLLFTVNGVVVDGVGDHRAMVVDVTSAELSPKKELWGRRRVITDRGDKDKIGVDLEASFELFDQYLVEKLVANQPNLDEIVKIFSSKVDQVRESNYSYKKSLI